MATQYNNKMHSIWDTISLEASANFCAKILAPGGKYGEFFSPKDANNIYDARIPREDAEVSYTAAYTALGDPVEKLGVRLDDNTANFEFHKKWITAIEPLLAAKKIKTHPLQILSGFEGILYGLAAVKSGTISGYKLVYTI
ncbi:hypothetical protein TrVFT333_004559 [Trichoderma virens FT-333]|nr:hypothetical protein TrVFT333_004559 [Trichoderma virens FT-333]